MGGWEHRCIVALWLGLGLCNVWAGPLQEPGCANKRCPQIYQQVCGTDDRTYNSKCHMEVTACNEHRSIELKHEGKCDGPPPLPIEAVEAEEEECPDLCNFYYDPVCGTDGKTYSNECSMQQESCNATHSIFVAYGGPCVVVPIRSTDACDVCQRIFRPVCASDGRTYTNACKMKAENCRKGHLEPVFVKFGSCQEGDVIFREPSSGECGEDEIEEAAEFGTSQLAAKLGSDVHFTLSYVESAKTQVVSGQNYILTVLIGASNCSTDQDYDKNACQIVNPDTNLRCDIVVFKPSSSNENSMQLTKHVCDKAFDFQNVCIGCPIDGTPDAESAYTVAEYIVRDLTNKAAKAHVIQNHLGLDNIKKYMKDSDGKGGFYYTVDLTVSESNCELDQEFDPKFCFGNRRDSRLCSAKVIESGPSQKLPRGVEIRRFEVTSTVCKDPHDTINLESQATVEDQDVIDVAKAITNQVGLSFGENVWLITQVISASRLKAEEGLNYALTLKFAESDCARSTVGNAEPDLLYGGVCNVEHTARSKTCQVLVNKRKNTYRCIGSNFALSILDQVCAQKKVCPGDCEQFDIAPVCGSDGKIYSSQCYMQQASCQKETKEEITRVSDEFCAKTKLQESIICAGCPQEGSKEKDEVRTAADFATLVLTSKYKNKHYFALDSITDVKAQVVAGTNYFLTIIIGESDCEVVDIENAVQEFDKEQCTINLEHDNNYMCEVVVYKPLKALGDNLILSQKNCRKVEVSKHVKLNCNMKCKKFYDPVCGTNGQTFLNDCLLKMASCINKDQVTKMSPGRCELDVSEVENEAHFAVRKLSNKFKNSNRWALKDVLSGSKVQDGVHLTLRLQETDCLKTQRSDAPCPIREGSPRRCEITVKNTTRGLTIKKNECNADVVTLCDECPEDAMDMEH